ncbi:hypothetical protein D3C78_1873460 [compost metagenome]
MLYAIGGKHEPHQRIGSDVENRRRRPNPQHKATNILGIPFAGFTQELFVHLVPRQGKLRNIVHQVL